MNTLSKIEQEIIDDFKTQLKERLGDNLVSIQLFGSKARGDFHKESDIDILAVLKRPTDEQINYIYDIAVKAGSKDRVYLSVKIFSEEEFNYYKSIPTRFITNVLKEGRVLV